jgi:hypothetical protein
MPPYSGDLSKRLISLQEDMGCASQIVEPAQPGEDAATNTLFKLQVSLDSACLCNSLKPEVQLFNLHRLVPTSQKTLSFCHKDHSVNAVLGK